MPSKTLIFLGLFLGSFIGGYLPILFGMDVLSYITVFTSGLGAIIGIWVGYKLGEF